MGLPRKFPRNHNACYLPPAGIQTRTFEKFRSHFILPLAPQMTMAISKPRVNDVRDKLYSRVPNLPPYDIPYDTTKPRKGVWGETLGTKNHEDSLFIYELWEQNKKESRIERENRLLKDAKADLQKRIDICLYGAPRKVPQKYRQ